MITQFSLPEIKKLNPLYFQKGLDKSFGIKKRWLKPSSKLNCQVIIEQSNNYYCVKKVSKDGTILGASTEAFDTKDEAKKYSGTKF